MCTCVYKHSHVWMDMGGLLCPLGDTVLHHQTPLPRTQVLQVQWESPGRTVGRKGLPEGGAESRVCVEKEGGCGGGRGWDSGPGVSGFRALENHEKPVTASWQHSQSRNTGRETRGWRGMGREQGGVREAWINPGSSAPTLRPRDEAPLQYLACPHCP